jgi:peptidoglycan-N-acetylglucosamine deacetylase
LKFIQPPYLAQWYYPNAIWRFSLSLQSLYLTFDDGPHPEITPKVLQILKQYNAKATFFCVGENVTKYPEVYQAILNDGHAVGNHTYNHLNGWHTSIFSYAKNIDKAAECIESNLFRPPYGKITKKQAKYLFKNQYKLVLWDVLTYDWMALENIEKHYYKIQKVIKTGSIIVLHDSIKAEENMFYFLKHILADFSKANYNFLAIR